MLGSRAHQKQQRAATARALALQKLQETGIDEETVGLGAGDPLAMPTRGLPSYAQGKPSPKAQRNDRFGLRRFLLRGLEKVTGEWSLMVGDIKPLPGPRWLPQGVTNT